MLIDADQYLIFPENDVLVKQAKFNLFHHMTAIQVHLNKLECRGKVHLFQ